jgi:UDP-N-acetylglucosamine 2-epimerase (non-hydrolysing)
MKLAPVMDALGDRNAEQVLVHTGQHYDANMSRVFFQELGLPRPDVNLGVGSGSHASQTGEVMKRIEPVLREYAPDVVLVYGDVNSTLAAALVAAKLHVPVAHVEAGLRSFDRTMPEEVNRVLTDQISDILFIHSAEAQRNLEREGIPPARVHLVGNTMIDTLVRLLPAARERRTWRELGLGNGNGRPDPYVLVTLHRPSNVDAAARLRRIFACLSRIAEGLPAVFPMHPRTRERLRRFGVAPECPGLTLSEPLGYLDFLSLEQGAAAVLTDSGGIQEETTFLGVPCFTIRPNTERPVTVEAGTNTLIADEQGLADLPRLVAAAAEARDRPRRDPPPRWDGRAGQRIADIISNNDG